MGILGFGVVEVFDQGAGASRDIDVEKPYLNFPVRNGAPMRHVRVLVDGKTERAFDIELADDKPDWWAFLDATPFLGKVVTITKPESFLPGWRRRDYFDGGVHIKVCMAIVLTPFLRQFRPGQWLSFGAGPLDP